ncbi:PD-(D/E)XK nuclease family protein [Natrarchaeobaculum sulfurireducens]|uniref:ATP-dependent exoDNAse (Exonuclease V) beta subunit (Contains helicase and exonuclease domains) n=1 Tax=Natrarchaeobaculum sulfurireducens TaxID=2044521 RepID=A0A346PFZ7_9EURY|nr:hypothetical protein [Natrarchaeobaculum sulfurireducens]AXR78442.1 ATP-dependent exoDNAse (exonuclease V) beta subunit (contains helicase and exonuclease domains) [Natrarchaeobaculum sulfurireducens]
MPPTEPSLEGTCKLRAVPEAGLLEFVAAEYAALADAHGARNVLVLKRQPTGLERVRATLADVELSDGSPSSPRVESVPEHASKVIEAHDPTLDRLEYEERIELISLVIGGASREVPTYLENASAHESFGRDVGQLLLEATRQRIGRSALEADADGGSVEDHDRDGDGPIGVARECLSFLYAMNDRFHEELTERGFVERADVIPRAVDLLEANADGLRARVTSEFDAVLALEFEEYRRLDRRYLAALSANADLVCLGERHASVERTRVEPGRIDDLVGDGLAVEYHDGPDGTGDVESRTPPHAAVTRFLAAGTPPTDVVSDPADGPDGTRTATSGRRPSGTVRTISTRTAREQVRAVATEVQSLCERHGWRYDAFAVAVPSIERVPETRRRLRESGVPTATIGTPSLAEDPAVNELYAVVSLQCVRARRRRSSDRHDLESEFGEDRTAAIERLRARVPAFTPELLEACADASVSRSLERWIRRTDLKGRIAAAEPWVDAREQFEGIRRVLEIARFVEETDLVGPDWEGLRRMLERTIRYDAPYVHAVEANPPTGGVAVCPVDALKYDRRRAVFVLDLIDEVYPGEQFLTQLFPTAWLRDVSAYPAVTDPAPETVVETFAPADADAVGDPFDAYHAQRARRRLAVASRAATDVCYFCSYERGSGGLRRTHDESRYLDLLRATPGLELEPVDSGSARIYGEANALETILDQPRAELTRVLREASTGGDADLAATEELFEEIALVLEADGVDDDLIEAVQSQFEFAAGEVVRGE